MNEKLKKRWINALKSGKYYQTRQELRGHAYYEETDEGFNIGGKIVDDYKDIPTGYCCLGVLCEITPGIEREGNEYIITQKSLTKLFKEDGVSGLWSRNEDGTINIDGEELPNELEKHFGLDRFVVMNGQRKTLQAKLITMNDEGVPFDQIAKYLEKVNF